jgi:hypothetical protein
VIAKVDLHASISVLYAQFFVDIILDYRGLFFLNTQIHFVTVDL